MDSISPGNKSEPGGSGVFSTTHWSVVFQAGHESVPGAQAALERLCKDYRYPLYVHVRRLGWGPEDAEDLTQQFLVRLIERKDLQRADPDRGRFRSFLLTSLKNFLADEWDKRHARKRGGGQPALSWDGVDPEERYCLEPVDALTPDQIYERRWAGTLLDNVLEQLGRTRASEPQQREFELLKHFVWGDGHAGTYAEVAAQLNKEVGAVKTAISRLRAEFQARIREEVRRTMDSPNPSLQQVDEELRYLQSLLRG